VLKWDMAVERNSINEFICFLNEYPNSRYKNIARQKVEELRFNRANNVNTAKAYYEYLSL